MRGFLAMENLVRKDGAVVSGERIELIEYAAGASVATSPTAPTAPTAPVASEKNKEQSGWRPSFY